MRTARSNAQPPTLWWGAGRVGKWSDRDLLLSLALTAYEDSLCPGCGQPKHKTFGHDPHGYYERDTLVCEGCATLADKPEKDPEPGEKAYLRYVTRSGQ